MILFKEDWNKYPTAIIDTKTTNKSFIRYSQLLKYMGIENHAFCLALHNPLLQGVDCRADNLSMETIAMIVIEAKENFWFIVRELVRLPPSSGVEPEEFIGNRGNISLYWLFFNHITTLLIQPRQTGKSVSTDVLMVILMSIMLNNAGVQLLTKDDSLRVINVKRIKDIMEQLPTYLKLKTRGDTNNTEKVTVLNLGNTYQTAVAQAAIKNALKLGRGMTLPIIHIDEIAFVANIEHTLAGMLPATGAARDIADKNGAPYGNIFTTTSGYLNTDSGKYVKENIYDKAFMWTEKLFDCLNLENLRKTISKSSRDGGAGNTVLLEFNHRQLGKTDAWLKEKISSAFSRGENAAADFLNIWASGGAESAIDKIYLDKIIASKVGDPYTDISGYGYATRWFVNRRDVEEGKMVYRKMVMGLDTSEAVGSDDIFMCIRDASTAEVIATGVYNETNTIMFSNWLADWLIKYPNLILAIERKNTGVSIIDNLLLVLVAKKIDPFKRLFNWVTDEANEKEEYYRILNTPMDKRDNDVYVKYRKEFGYATSGSGKAARDNLYGTALNSSLKYTSHLVRCSTVSYQISRLITKNGRIDHRPGEHDDAVIAWLLAYWFLSQAKNKQYYGLSSNIVLSAITLQDIEERGGINAIEEQKNNNIIKDKINTLLEMLDGNIPIYKKKLLYSNIKSLNEQLSNHNRFLNIDELLEKTGKDTPDIVQQQILKPYSSSMAIGHNTKRKFM